MKKKTRVKKADPRVPQSMSVEDRVTELEDRVDKLESRKKYMRAYMARTRKE